MLDEPKDPNLSNTPEEPAGDSGFSPEPSQPVELPAGEKTGQPEGKRTDIEQSAGEETPLARLGTGSLFQRLTGTLRRVTGPLRTTSELTPKETRPPIETGQLKKVDPILTGRLGDETGSETPDVNKPALPEEPGLLPPIPLPSSRREVPDSGIVTASLPELEEEPIPGAMAQPETGQPGADDEAPESTIKTGNLFERITGNLRRVTGPLHDTGSVPGQESQPAPETGQFRESKPVKSRQLEDESGSESSKPEVFQVPEEPEMLPPIPLPGSRREVPDSGILNARLLGLEEEPQAGTPAGPELSQPPTGQEADTSSLGTGSLFQRLTGSLRRVTGPLDNTGSISPQANQTSQETGQPKQSETILTGQPGSQSAISIEPAASDQWMGSEEPQVPLESIVLEEGQPIPIPESRREVPDSGIITAGLPVLEEEPEPVKGPEPDISQPQTEAGPSPAKTGTGSLIQRVTGTLRRVTGSLRDTGSIPSQEGQPTSETEQTGHLPTKRRPAGPDYVSDLRKTLTSEEEADRTKRSTGSLIQRLTGRLRRVTGALRATDALPPAVKETPPAEPEVSQPQIEDDFLSGRLVGTQSSELITSDEVQPMQLPASWVEQPGLDSGIEAAELLEMEEDQLTSTKPEPEILLGDDEPITLLESGAIAALGRAEEASHEEEPDWMAEIRREAAQTDEQIEDQPAAFPPYQTGFEPGPEQPGIEQPEEDQGSRRGNTGNIRSFITGMLGLSAAKDKQAEETEYPDEMLTGRLGRSLGIEAPPATDLQAEELLEVEEIYPSTETGEAPVEQPPAGEEVPVFPLTVEEESPLLGGLEVSFSQIEGVEESTLYELHPEDEQLLWGDITDGVSTASGEQTITEFPVEPENIWGDNQAGITGYGADLRQEIWGEEAAPEVPEEQDRSVESGEYVASDEYAAAYLTGEGLAKENQSEEGTQETGADKEMSAEDLRSIALEDYEEGEFDYEAYKTKIDWGDEEGLVGLGIEAPEPPAVEEAKEPLRAEIQAGEFEGPAVAGDWRTWLASRKTSQKLLLAEGTLVVLAILVAVPFFVYMIIRGPIRNSGAAIQNRPTVSSPYPTGLTLPGGWYFPLGMSTMTDGKWQPVTSEWLVGSELRRVIALPWNRQTEAVIRTFQAGDPVEVLLSNNSTQKYKVASVKQVPVGDSKILLDNRPSLLIILYKENDPSRWVVIGQP